MVQLTSLPGLGDGSCRRLHPHEWLTAAQRASRARALAVALAHGVSVSADAVTVVLASRAWCEEFPPGVWSAEIVRQLLWLDLGTWCGEFDVELPDDAPMALWAVLFAARSAGELTASELDDALAPLLDSSGFRLPGQGRGRRRAG
ncbi:MAG: hypothetical protein ACR2QE_07850 [Acidimicrobiales bacterium]